MTRRTGAHPFLFPEAPFPIYLSSTIGKLRLPFLQERADALLCVVAADQTAELIGFELAGLRPAASSAAFDDRLQRRLHWSACSWPRSSWPVPWPRQHLARGHDLVGQAEAERFLSVDHVAGQDQLEGLALPDDARQALRAAPAGDDAQVGLGAGRRGPRSARMRMWQAIASSRPPPSATALMAAMTGLGQPRSC